MKTRSLKNSSTHLATRCVLSALAIVTVTSISNVESAHAMYLGGGSFRPSMPRITPRVTMPHISVGSGGVAAAANAAGYSHGPKSSSYGANAAGAGGYGSGGKGAGVAGASAWGHNKWLHPKPDQHVVEHVPKNPCGTKYRKDHFERGCDIPPKHVVVNGGTDGGYTPPTKKHPGHGGVIVTGPSPIGPTAAVPSNIGPSNIGPSNTGPSLVGPARPRSGVPPADVVSYVTNEIVVEHTGTSTEQTYNTFAARYRLSPVGTHSMALTDTNFVRYRLLDIGRTVPAVLRAIEADMRARTTASALHTVLSTQPNYLFSVQQDQSTEAEKGQSSEAQPATQAGDSAQYALAKLHIPEAQTLARGESVVVAVIDTD